MSSATPPSVTVTFPGALLQVMSEKRMRINIYENSTARSLIDVEQVNKLFLTKINDSILVIYFEQNTLHNINLEYYRDLSYLIIHF